MAKAVRDICDGSNLPESPNVGIVRGYSSSKSSSSNNDSSSSSSNNRGTYYRIGLGEKGRSKDPTRTPHPIVRTLFTQ